MAQETVASHAKPIRKLTVMIDACVYRGNPAVGEQLACLISLLKKQGVQCEVLEDRFGLMEATNHSHELMLSEDMDYLHSRLHNSGKRALSKYPPPDYVANYLHATGEIAHEVPITYMDSPAVKTFFTRREDFTREHLLKDERLRTEWPEIKKALRDHRIDARDLDDFHHAVYTTCVKCAHTIAAINERMKREPGLRASLTQEDRYNFMLDRHKQNPVYWDKIDLATIDPGRIPTIVSDAFGKTRVTQKLLGKGKELTPLGQEMMRHQHDLGEKLIAAQARGILTATPDKEGHVVMLISDDGGGIHKFERLEKEFPNCTPISSRELSTIVLALASNGLAKHFTRFVTDNAREISEGRVRTNSSIARSAHYIPSGDGSFVSRIYATAHENQGQGAVKT